MKNFFRGAGVHISVVFLAADGTVVTPTGANVTLSYVPKAGVSNNPSERTFQTFALSQDSDGNWVYDWDSSPAHPCIVFANAATTTPNVPVSSVDFSFRLTANRANRELAGDDVVSDGYA